MTDVAGTFISRLHISRLQMRENFVETFPGLVDEASREDCVSIPIGATLADAERKIIAATLRRCGGNKTRAAAMLGVSLKTLYNRLNDYRLADSDASAASEDAPVAAARAADVMGSRA